MMVLSPVRACRTFVPRPFALTCTDRALATTARRESSIPRVLSVAAELTASAMALYPMGGRTRTPSTGARFLGPMVGRIRRKSDSTLRESYKHNFMTIYVSNLASWKNRQSPLYALGVD